MESFPRTTRVAWYNSAFSCEAQSLEAFQMHGRFLVGDNEGILKLSHPERTVETVQKSQADVVGIGEIFGASQRKRLIELLKEIGFRQFCVGTNDQVQGDWHIETLLASRGLELEQSTPPFKLGKDASAWGGHPVYAHVPDLGLDILQMHLPLPKGTERRREYFHQMTSALEFLVDKQSPSILMGDFNSPEESLRTFYPELRKFNHLSLNGDTYFAPGPFSLFFHREFDHIWGKNVVPMQQGKILGNSDHFLVWSDIALDTLARKD